MKAGAGTKLKKVAINIMPCCGIGKIYSESDPDPIFQVFTDPARDLALIRTQKSSTDKKNTGVNAS